MEEEASHQGPFQTLISITELREQRNATWVLIDARHDLTDSRAGHAAY